MGIVSAAKKQYYGQPGALGDEFQSPMGIVSAAKPNIGFDETPNLKVSIPDGDSFRREVELDIIKC